MKTTPIVLSLTSIPPRFKYLPQFFKRLEKQTLRPVSVEINLAKSYRRFPGELPALPNLPEWVKVLWQDTDFGPATKILPTIERYKNSNQDILACDDDRIYGRQWIQGFAYQRHLHPEGILCACGFNIDEYYDLRRVAEHKKEPVGRYFRTPELNKVHLQQVALEKITFNLRNGEWRQLSYPGYIDIFEGFRGYLIKPHYLPEEAWNIVDDFWMVDDVWLSGMAALNSHYAWLHDMPMNRDYDRRIDRLHGLYTIEEEGKQRDELNKRCIAYFQEKYGIW